MSHLSSVECFVTNLEDLEAVLDPLGCELRRGQTTFKWFGRWAGGGDALLRQFGGKCEHAVHVKKGGRDCYEIGLITRRDGEPGWELIYDNWQGGYGLEAAVGKDLVKLKNGLLAHVTRQQLSSEGYSVTEEIDPATGNLVLVAEC